MTHHKAPTLVIPIREASGAFREPTLEEILSDSIVEAVMQADAVDPNELRVMFGKIAHARRLLTAGAEATPRFQTYDADCSVA
jgi:hypothetical protein